MSRLVRIPPALHEVLGRTQAPAQLVLVSLAAVGLGAAICIAGADALAEVSAWRAVLAAVLIIDVAAGCVANFTTGTDRHYAERPRSRWIFIAVHWHLVVVGLLLEVAVIPLLIVTLYALLAAVAVNLLHRHPVQVTVGGTLMAAGIVGVVLWMPAGTPLFLVATSGLFIVKVVFAFAVTHHPAAAEASSADLSGQHL
jgi:hypothetical protein